MARSTIRQRCIPSGTRNDATSIRITLHTTERLPHELPRSAFDYLDLVGLRIAIISLALYAHAPERRFVAIVAIDGQRLDTAYTSGTIVCTRLFDLEGIVFMVYRWLANRALRNRFAANRFANSFGRIDHRIALFGTHRRRATYANRTQL